MSFNKMHNKFAEQKPDILNLNLLVLHRFMNQEEANHYYQQNSQGKLLPGHISALKGLIRGVEQQFFDGANFNSLSPEIINNKREGINSWLNTALNRIRSVYPQSNPEEKIPQAASEAFPVIEWQLFIDLGLMNAKQVEVYSNLLSEGGFQDEYRDLLITLQNDILKNIGTIDPPQQGLNLRILDKIKQTYGVELEAESKNHPPEQAFLEVSPPPEAAAQASDKELGQHPEDIRYEPKAPKKP